MIAMVTMAMMLMRRLLRATMSWMFKLLFVPLFELVFRLLFVSLMRILPCATIELLSFNRQLAAGANLNITANTLNNTQNTDQTQGGLIYAKVSKRRKIKSKQLPTHQLKTNVMNCYRFLFNW
jgi:hypothetical protein